MDFNVLSIFPGMFQGMFDTKIITRAIDNKLFSLNVHDIRTFTTDKHHTVDDTPYGGGPGMVMKPEPLVNAIEHVEKNTAHPPYRIYLTPKGTPWTQERAQSLLTKKNLLLVCGRYRGIDQRVIDGWIDEEVSVGPFILGGGETAALVILETMIRLIPGVLGNEDSLSDETTLDQHEPPQYTKPRVFRGHRVPEALLSGNPKLIEAWQRSLTKNNV